MNLSQAHGWNTPVALLLLGASLWGSAGCHSSDAHGDQSPARGIASAEPAASAPLVVLPRADTIPTYPCRQCHDLRPTDRNRRELAEYHTTIKLQHGPALPWCDSCHTFDEYDSLHLMDGTLVPFDEAYRVCGQCHGEKFRDWKSGDHGLQTGGWATGSVKRSCTACHSPHEPKFAKLKPMPPPQRPRGFSGTLGNAPSPAAPAKGAVHE